MPMNHSSSKRFAPRGGKRADRVEFTLEPEGRAEIDQMAQEGGISRSAVLREIHLLGLPLYREARAANAART